MDWDDDSEEEHLRRVLAIIAEIDRMTDEHPCVLDLVVERKKRQAARRLCLPQ